MSILDIDKGWFSALVAQHAYLDSVPMPQRRAWNFVGTGWAITDNPDEQSLEISIVGIEDIDTRLSAIETFFSPAPTSEATPDTLVLRDGTGHTEFNTLTVRAIAGENGIDIGADTHDTVVIGDSVDINVDAELRLYQANQERWAMVPDPAFKWLFNEECTSALIGWLPAVGGAGNPTTIAGQDGAAGFAGGNLTLRGGLGGTPGTNVAGHVKIDLGQQAGGSTAYFQLDQNGANFMLMRCVGTVSYISSVGGLQMTAAGESSFTTASGNFSVTAASGVYLSGTSVNIRDASANLRASWSTAAATALRFAAACTSVTITQTQATSGAGVNMTLRAQQGFAGSDGGDLILGGGDAGSAGTNNPGDIIVNLGTPLTASGATGVFYGQTETGARVWSLYRVAATTTALYFGNPGGDLAGIVRGASLNLEASSTSVNLAAVTDLNMMGSQMVRTQPGTGAAYYRDRLETVQTTDGALTNLFTFATTNNRVYHVEARVTASNDTDNTGYSALIIGTLKNVAGTLSLVGAPVAVYSSGDYSPDLDPEYGVSGASIVVSARGTAAKTVNWNVVANIYERVLA